MSKICGLSFMHLIVAWHFDVAGIAYHLPVHTWILSGTCRRHTWIASVAVKLQVELKVVQSSINIFRLYFLIFGRLLKQMKVVGNWILSRNSCNDVMRLRWLIVNSYNHLPLCWVHSKHWNVFPLIVFYQTTWCQTWSNAALMLKQ